MPINQFITRIEGHGNLKIDFRKQKAQILVEESERLFEQLVVNYSYQRAPFITARICGICPTAHYLAAIKAIEQAFEVKPTETTIKLRELLLAGQMIQSHSLHLFFLVLPDYTKSETIKSFSQEYPAEFHLGLNLKKIGDRIVKLLGGREIHPLTPQVGGFKKLPSYGQIKEISEKIRSVLDEAQDSVRLFDRIDYPDIEQTEREYLSLKSSGYPLLRGREVATAENDSFLTEDYSQHIIEEERRGTLVKFSRFKQNRSSSLFMVGALARINNNHHSLNKSARETLARSQLIVPSTNPFDNIRAQAVEILHYLEEAKEIVDNLRENELDKTRVKVEPKRSEGVGAVEAPRGVLYHCYRFNQQGEIIKADIVTPTAQSMLSLEADADHLIKLYQRESQAKKRQLIEQLIRAYDPCLTCSVH